MIFWTGHNTYDIWTGHKKTTRTRHATHPPAVRASTAGGGGGNKRKHQFRSQKQKEIKGKQTNHDKCGAVQGAGVHQMFMDGRQATPH